MSQASGHVFLLQMKNLSQALSLVENRIVKFPINFDKIVSNWIGNLHDLEGFQPTSMVRRAAAE